MFSSISKKKLNCLVGKREKLFTEVIHTYSKRFFINHHIQLTLEQYGFELHRSAYMQIFFNKQSSVV